MNYWHINEHKGLNRTLSVVIISIVFSFQCLAQESRDNEWQILFNGENLSGWEMLNGQHEAKVVDGVISVTTVYGEPNGFLCTTEDYDDFILELEVKSDFLLDNSGIMLRSHSHVFYNDGRVHGYQAQIENRPGHVSKWSGAIYDEARRGWLYILEDDPVRQNAYVQNQWNHYRIEAIGTTSRVWVNGIPTSHLVDSEIISTEYLTNDKTTHGFICLQAHGGRHADERGSQSVYMRNVRIQTDNFQPSPYDKIPVVNLIPNNISGQEEHQGFKLLFDGETTKNWRGIRQKDIPETGWEVEDGMLTIFDSGNNEALEGNSTGIIMTQEEYGSFELKFEFKQLSEEAVQGIEYLVQESQNEFISVH